VKKCTFSTVQERAVKLVFFFLPLDLCTSTRTTRVSVPLLKQSDPAISRFCPVLGCRTMLQLLARRAAESNAFSVPDRNALWSRAEDDLLVQAAVKHSTSDVLFPDWSEVVSELPGRYKQQCKERYRLADTVVELTFVFLRVTFRGSPFLRSSHVLTKDADSADSARPTFDASSPSPAPSLCPPSSLTHAHRCIGSRNPTRHSVPNSARLTYLSVYESRDGVSEPASSPSPPSSLTHVHRYIGSRNPTRHSVSVPNYARLMYLSMYDSRDGVSEPAPFPSPPSSLMHAHSIQSHTLLTPTSAPHFHVHSGSLVSCAFGQVSCLRRDHGSRY
jgi:hypothetical protein